MREPSGEGSEAKNCTVAEFTGVFGGLPSSPLAIPVVFEKPLLDRCERVAVFWDRPGAWKRNDSAQTFATSFDEVEGALRFDCAWTTPGDRWCYPEYTLSLPRESQEGAEFLEFEVRSAQNKPENDFTTANLMLVFEDGLMRRIPFDPPLDGWERRRVSLRGVEDLVSARAIRIGANPRGTSLSLWFRGIRLLRSASPANPSPRPL